MDEAFANVALQGFEGMRRSGPAWRYSIRSSRRPQFRPCSSLFGFNRMIYTTNTNSAYASEEDPEYIHDQCDAAEHISCHGLEPAAQGALAAELYGVACERLAADPEHSNACEQGAQRDDIDGDGIHPRA